MTGTDPELQQQQEGERGVSGERVVYPRVNSGRSGAAQDYETGRWGTYTMGSPSKPQAHPENQQAATWEPLPGNILDVNSEVSSEQKAHNQAPSSSSTGYVNPPSSQQSNPYVSTVPASSLSGKSPMDIIADYLSRWTKKFDEVAKKAEEAAGNIWQHMKTGPNMADTAWGRLNQGAKLLTEGGYEKIFRQTFETSPEERLLKSYACYLSTSSGPVAGTLYISTKKIAFSSDRPLSYQPSPGQTAWTFYKVVILIDKMQAVNPSSNVNNPVEKYVQVLTVDNHEFWFMGFVNYDKAVKNLQEVRQQNR